MASWRPSIGQLSKAVRVWNGFGDAEDFELQKEGGFGETPRGCREAAGLDADRLSLISVLYWLNGPLKDILDSKSFSRWSWVF
jgi:hypothetical protein